MKKMRFLFFIGFILMLVNFSACNKLENATTSASKLMVDIITGTDLTGSAGSTTIFSDVVIKGGIFNDSAEATVRAVLLDPYGGALPNTFYQTIIIDRIQIEYSRSDGLSEQGKDVPYAFSQDVNVSIDIDSVVSFSFVLVQHTAKLEPPLLNLRYALEVLKMEAKITFYGKDVGGRRIAPVTGSVSVWFADFADEE
ncbi:MAG: hypothetical protein KAT34_07580 [Candidatus Aminicenantes bacterium]|nr:hypothetical protein [Candidatus Aminicenantes bacterium]